MVCSDLPKVTTRAVAIGDVVQLSAVRPHPTNTKPFGYKGAECRYFIETDVGTVATDLYTWQGVICNVRQGEWQVVDKW